VCLIQFGRNAADLAKTEDITEYIQTHASGKKTASPHSCDVIRTSEVDRICHVIPMSRVAKTPKSKGFFASLFGWGSSKAKPVKLQKSASAGTRYAHALNTAANKTKIKSTTPRSGGTSTTLKASSNSTRAISASADSADPENSSLRRLHSEPLPLRSHPEQFYSAESQRAATSGRSATTSSPPSAVLASGHTPKSARKASFADTNALTELTHEDRAALAEFQRSIRQLLLSGTHLQELMSRVEAHDHTLQMLVGKEKECPSLFWFYPRKPELRSWLWNPCKCLFQDTLMMVVVCPVTLCMVPCGPDGVGWEVALPKQWVKTWAPAILFSIYVLQAAVLAGRVVGIPLPPVLGVGSSVQDVLGFNTMLGGSYNKRQNQTSVFDSLTAFAGATVEILDLDPADASEMKHGFSGPIVVNGRLSTALPASLPIPMVGEAYKSIHAFLTTGENAKLGKLEDQLRGRMERVMAPDGDIEWVSMEGKDAWLAKHAQLVRAEAHAAPHAPVLRAVTPQHTAKAKSLKEPPSSWLTLKMQERGFTDATALAHLDQVLVSSSGEGFTTEASFAALPPAELHVDYLKSLGVTAKGTQMQLISLHKELHLQYCSGATAPAEGVSLTAEEKARLLEVQNTVRTLTAELQKLRAATVAGSSQVPQRSGGGGGGKGGLMLKQAQCNVVNPRTRQPYSMDELVDEVQRLHAHLARHSTHIKDVAWATKEGFEELGLAKE
jgi:hypothetical protein